MSKRVYLIATSIVVALVVSFAVWPGSHKESINNSPAPRAPASIPKKLNRILPLPPSKAAIRLPPSGETPTAAAERKDEFLSRFRLGAGKAVAVGDDRFEMLSLRAVPTDDYRHDLGEKIATKLGYVIFHSREGSLAFQGSLPVVAKKSNGTLGIVTGTIIVRLKESALALTLAESYKITLKYIDDDLRIAYYSLTDNSALAQVVELLKRDVAVETVNLEIVNSKKGF